jgi:hypothetical protein
MARQTIIPGSAPIVWSTVDDAFKKINDNFAELYLSIGGEAVDLTSLSTSLIPSSNVTYDLGSTSKRWRDLYLSGETIHLGNALISSTGTSINLPPGSTIGGSVLDSEYFREIVVAGQSNIVANAGGNSILTIATSTGVSVTTNSTTDTLTFSNTGVTSAIAGTGIGVNSSTGAVTITNTGVVTATSGTGINITGTNNLTISNTGVISVVTDPGSGISLDTSVPGVVRISNSAPFTPQNTFQNFVIPGPTTIQADSTSDTLTFENGTGINITGNATSDTISITNTGVTSLGVTGVGLSITGSTGSVNITNTGVVAISAGDGIGINTSTGTVVVTNTRFGFTSIAVAGQSSLLADNTTDTFTLIAGEGVTLTTDNITDSLKIDVSYLVGNVFSDSSTLLVNAATGKIVGDIETSRLRTSESRVVLGVGAGTTGGSGASLTIGTYAGYTNQGTGAIAVGPYAGETNQGTSGMAIGPYSGQTGQGLSTLAVGVYAGQTNQGNVAVALGAFAGNVGQGTNAVSVGPYAGANNQGAGAVAIGLYAGTNNQFANSIVINASGATLDATAAGFYVDPIREVTGPQVLYYNPSDKEITWGPVPSGGGGGGGDSYYEFSVAGDDSTLRQIFSGETLRFAGAGGITTATDGEGKVTITGTPLSGIYGGVTYNQSNGDIDIATTGQIQIMGAASATVILGGGTSGDIVFQSGTQGIDYNDLTNLPTLVSNINSLSDVTITTPANGQVLTYDSATSQWKNSAAGGGGSGLGSRAALANTTASLINGATGNLTIVGYKGYALYKIQTSAAAWVRIYTDIAARTADASRAEGADPLPGSGVIAEVITTGSQTILVSPGAIGFSNEATPDTNIQLAVTNKSGSTGTITVTLTAVELEI